MKGEQKYTKLNILILCISTREKSLDGITYKRLVELTIGFFSTEQSVQDKLENGSKRLEMVKYKTMLRFIQTVIIHLAAV